MKEEEEIYLGNKLYLSWRGDDAVLMDNSADEITVMMIDPKTMVMLVAEVVKRYKKM